MNAILMEYDFKHGSEPIPRKWEGLGELDRALADNRLTEYRWKMAWADPWSRLEIILVFAVLLAFVGYVVVNDLIL